MHARMLLQPEVQCQRSLIVAGDGVAPSRHLINYP